jgi:DNA-binding transcriptional MerR regulator
MKIGDIAERTGLTTHTIRYYERIGLLPSRRGTTRVNVFMTHPSLHGSSFWAG